MSAPGMDDRPLELHTYLLIDGRRVTYAGRSEADAFNRARDYHLDAVVAHAPVRACQCESKQAKSVREAGWLICDRGECAGIIGS